MSELSEGRMLICSTCPYNVDNICILCGCDLLYKVEQLEESCPLTPPNWLAQSQIPIIKPEIESAPAQVSTLESTAPQPRAVCLPCQNKNR